ncbi:hypothetical protein GS4_11_00180 [Gordonia soli NBRC 108243]|uniref:Uncharacterized protein n=1 Tax=Gordonia soli NBRC 108243 TaxID=1223545 RepID=M0QGJ4_9ACTN|nr:hypothetical protein GS4_11_00180 [Gordonia soli NBRC 108243]
MLSAVRLAILRRRGPEGGGGRDAMMLRLMVGRSGVVRIGHRRTGTDREATQHGCGCDGPADGAADS